MKAPRDIAPGSGTHLRCSWHPRGVVRTHEGGLHKPCPTCPHSGGLVRWNSTEDTWECPVHGARYDTYGLAIDGPATAD